MENNTSYYIEKLKSSYENRRAKNSSYSLRAYAKFLEIDSSVIAAIFKGKRELPLKYAQPICSKLKLTATETEGFIFSIKLQKNRKRGILASNSEEQFNKKILQEEKYYNVISKWEYYTLLNLTTVQNFVSDHEWIANKMGITINLVKSIIEELLALNLMTIDDKGNYKRTHKELATTQDIYSKALRESHKQILSLAIEKIETVPLENRFYSNSTFPINIKNISLAKELIRDFRSKLCELLEDDNCSEVYNLSLGLFPLTQTEENKTGEQNEKLH